MSPSLITRILFCGEAIQTYVHTHKHVRSSQINWFSWLDCFFSSHFDLEILHALDLRTYEYIRALNHQPIPGTYLYLPTHSSYTKKLQPLLSVGCIDKRATPPRTCTEEWIILSCTCIFSLCVRHFNCAGLERTPLLLIQQRNMQQTSLAESDISMQS